MAALVAAVVIVGALGMFNLLLLVGVLRRLTQYQQSTTEIRNSAPAFPDLIGKPLPAFVATSSEGVSLVAANLVGRLRLAAFFSTTCGACRDEVPAFVRYAATVAADRGYALAVVCGAPDGAEEMTSALAATSFVILEEDHGPVARAFGVAVFPTMLAYDADGRIFAAEPSVVSLEQAMRHAQTAAG